MLEGVIAEHDAIKHEVGLLRQLVEKTSGDRGLELVGADAGPGDVHFPQGLFMVEFTAGAQRYRS